MYVYLYHSPVLLTLAATDRRLKDDVCDQKMARYSSITASPALCLIYQPDSV